MLRDRIRPPLSSQPPSSSLPPPPIPIPTPMIASSSRRNNEYEHDLPTPTPAPFSPGRYRARRDRSPPGDTREWERYHRERERSPPLRRSPRPLRDRVDIDRNRDRRGSPPREPRRYRELQPQSRDLDTRQGREAGTTTWSQPMRRKSTGSNFFKGFTFYVHSSGGEAGWKGREEVGRKSEIIQSHGGTISKIPNTPKVTHIILLLNPSYPQNVVLQIDTSGPDLPSLEHQQDWRDNDLIRYYSKLVGRVPLEESKNGGLGNKRKIVLRQEWVENCVRSDRVVGRFDDYGGWEIKGTYDPQHVNITPFGEPFENPSPVVDIPYSPFTNLGRGIANRSYGPNCSIETILPISLSGRLEVRPDDDSPATVLTEPASLVTAVNPIDEIHHVTARTEDDRKPLPSEQNAKTEGDISDHQGQETDNEDIKPIIIDDDDDDDDDDDIDLRPDLRPDTPELPSPQQRDVYFPQHTSPVSAPAVEGVAHTDLSHDITNTTGHTRTPSPSLDIKVPLQSPMTTGARTSFPFHIRASSSRTQLEKHGIEEVKGVFARGLLPLGFHVIGSVREKRSIEILITRTGSGIISPKPIATIYILPISPEDILSDPSHLEIIDEISNNPCQAVVSVDWVYECIESDQLLSLDGYLIRKDDRVSDGGRSMISPALTESR